MFSMRKTNWIEAFVNIKCPRALIEEVLRLKSNSDNPIIEDIARLYKIYSRLLPSIRETIRQPWQLLCLSGEINALNFVILTQKPTSLAKKQQIIFHATLSGNPSALTHTLNIDDLGIPVNASSDFNILHYATFSGSEAQVKKVLEIEEEYFIKTNQYLFSRLAKKSRHVLHLAAAVGNENIFDILHEDSYYFHTHKNKTDNPPAFSLSNIQDQSGFSCIDYAYAQNHRHLVKKLSTSCTLHPQHRELDFGEDSNTNISNHPLTR